MISKLKRYLRNKRRRRDWAKLSGRTQELFTALGLAPWQCEAAEKLETTDETE